MATWIWAIPREKTSENEYNMDQSVPLCDGVTICMSLTVFLRTSDGITSMSWGITSQVLSHPIGHEFILCGCQMHLMKSTQERLRASSGSTKVLKLSDQLVNGTFPFPSRCLELWSYMLPYTLEIVTKLVETNNQIRSWPDLTFSLKNESLILFLF